MLETDGISYVNVSNDLFEEKTKNILNLFLKSNPPPQ